MSPTQASTPAGATFRDAPYWHDLVRTADAVLRAPKDAGFVQRLRQLRASLSVAIDEDADAALLALLFMLGRATQQHCALHALACCAAITAVGLQASDWSAEDRRIAGLAALSMNAWMTALHDDLMQQHKPPTVAQRSVVAVHASGAASLLVEHGVSDATWLQAVEHHHDAPPGPLWARPQAQQLARLLQRLDLYLLGLTPTAARPAGNSVDTAKSIYFAEDGLPDETGMAIIRVLGIYPPGTPVQLASGEQALVVRRGASADRPILVGLGDGQGRSPGAPALREASGAQSQVAKALRPDELRACPGLDVLLALEPGGSRS